MTYPTVWQRKTIWASLTTLAIIAIVAAGIGVIWTGVWILGYLQPILIPIAVAAVLAYLLEPAVRKLVEWKVPRTPAVALVFALFIIGGALILLWIIPVIYQQSVELANNIPSYVDSTRLFINDLVARFETRFGDNPYVQDLSNQAKEQLPSFVPAVWGFLAASFGGLLGFFGFIFGAVMVPICLFYFLKESRNIHDHWARYVPLRASAFKDEVVSVLLEINGYLIAFFRGQLLVSMVDGVLTGVALLFIIPKFAALIGLMVAVLAIIPYLGVILCWLPAVIIAAVQWGDWQHPLAVTIIFIAVQQLEGYFIAPKIVGESVGLHPLTVILAVFGWTILIGGLLGAILAVPLTATLKVLLRRYVWQRRFRELNEPSPPPAPVIVT